MTGGRRGICVNRGYRGRYPDQGYGVGRGGRPYRGGRGYAWGGGRGYGRSYWDSPVQPADYPVPNYSSTGLADTICTILDRLNELAENIAQLRGKTSAKADKDIEV
jgi:hypothetical protein